MGLRVGLFTELALDMLCEILYACSMRHMLTAKLKGQTDPAQFVALRVTQVAYRAASNYVSRYSFARGKQSNQEWVQREPSTEVRAGYHLPAHLACNVPRQVGATDKTLWTKVKQNNAARKARRTKKRSQGLDRPPKYGSPTLTDTSHRDYRLKPDHQVRMLTLEGRMRVSYTGSEKHLALLQHGAHIGAANLWYDKPHQQFYLLVSLEVELVDPTPHPHQHIVGVDGGQRYLAVIAPLSHGACFYAGTQVRAKADHYAGLRKRLQHTGTRWATRRLVRLSRRERRLKHATHHEISRRIVDQHPHRMIGLEELTHMRERTQRTHGKRATRTQRRANGHASAWAFAQVHASIASKALMANSMAVKVDADYPSQACPRCGHTCEGNRPNKALLFVCQSCHYRLHAALVGARTVALTTLLARQDWTRTGVWSGSPDVSSDEAKAARLRRYAEVRGSPDTSPCL